MKRTLLAWGSALALAATLVPSSPARSASYDDAACDGPPATWADDPCAGEQWGVANVRAPEAWGTTRGDGVTIAVVDTGTDLRHPDLSANVVAVRGADVTKNAAFRCPWQRAPKKAKSSSALAQDDNGHGTHVSGIVAAVADNGFGVAGVAPRAEVMPVKVLDSEGSGTDEDVARGICFAVEHGADVVNLSLGFDPVASIVVTGLGSETDAAISHAYARGVAVVIAAGNESFPACDFPASHTAALCVGAVDSADRKAYYSNFGDVDLVAPGGIGSVFCHDPADVWSTVLPGAVFDCGDDGFDTLAGTSMAAPHVAAVAALVIAAAGGRLHPDVVYARLTGTATDLGPTGVDPAFGHGRVDAAAAVAAASSGAQTSVSAPGDRRGRSHRDDDRDRGRSRPPRSDR